MYKVLRVASENPFGELYGLIMWMAAGSVNTGIPYFGLQMDCIC
ncbi:MAG TPA: hypothetical protein VFQ23_00060 [Anaerolineales bacterium]|nr:hypothetical protein [Anaerolineales bacterium]